MRKPVFCLVEGLEPVCLMFVTESETKLGLGQNGAKPVRLLASDKQESKPLKKEVKK